jgi:hypothetical protein
MNFDDEKYEDFLFNFQVYLSNQSKDKRERFFDFCEGVIETTYKRIISGELNKDDKYYSILLENLLGLYEDREEYDRCIELKKIIDNTKTK